MISLRIIPFVKRLAAICVAALSLTGCDGAGQQSDSDFPLNITLTCREKPMGTILKPGSLFTCGGKPEVRYRLSKPVESFVVLPSPDRIAAINPDLTDDAFLIFNL